MLFNLLFIIFSQTKHVTSLSPPCRHIPPHKIPQAAPLPYGYLWPRQSSLCDRSCHRRQPASPARGFQELSIHPRHKCARYPRPISPLFPRSRSLLYRRSAIPGHSGRPPPITRPHTVYNLSALCRGSNRSHKWAELRLYT